MLLKDYEQQGLLFNSNLTEACSDGQLTAYRGELVIQQGEVTDSMGRRSPPTKVLQQVAMLAGTEKLAFISGLLEDIADLGALLERIQSAFGTETLPLIFVFNIEKPVVIDHQGTTVYLQPLHDGLVWTELMDLAALEKGDTKGLSSADKVLAVFRELRGFKPRGSLSATLAETSSLGNGKQREVRGAV